VRCGPSPNEIGTGAVISTTFSGAGGRPAASSASLMFIASNHIRRKSQQESPAIADGASTRNDASAYLRVAHIYMLISMPTGTSTIFGAFQAIWALPFIETGRKNSAFSH
jgi:hypothetical protein